MSLKGLNLSHGDLSSANPDCNTVYFQVETTKELSIIGRPATDGRTKVGVGGGGDSIQDLRSIKLLPSWR